MIMLMKTITTIRRDKKEDVDNEFENFVYEDDDDDGDDEDDVEHVDDDVDNTMTMMTNMTITTMTLTVPMTTRR